MFTSKTHAFLPLQRKIWNLITARCLQNVSLVLPKSQTQHRAHRCRGCVVLTITAQLLTSQLPPLWLVWVARLHVLCAGLGLPWGPANLLGSEVRGTAPRGH